MKAAFQLLMAIAMMLIPPALVADDHISYSQHALNPDGELRCYAYGGTFHIERPVVRYHADASNAAWQESIYAESAKIWIDLEALFAYSDFRLDSEPVAFNADYPNRRAYGSVELGGLWTRFYYLFDVVIVKEGGRVWRAPKQLQVRVTHEDGFSRARFEFTPMIEFGPYYRAALNGHLFDGHPRWVSYTVSAYVTDNADPETGRWVRSDLPLAEIAEAWEVVKECSRTYSHNPVLPDPTD